MKVKRQLRSPAVKQTDVLGINSSKSLGGEKDFAFLWTNKRSRTEKTTDRTMYIENPHNQLKFNNPATPPIVADAA